MKGKIRKNRNMYYIDLHFNGKRYSIYRKPNGETFSDSLKEAEKTLVQINIDIQNGTFNISDYTNKCDKKLLFQNYAREYLSRRQSEIGTIITKGTYSIIRNHFENYIIPFFTNKNITEIRSADIEDFIISLPDDLSPKTKKNILGDLHKLFTDAYNREDILRMPKFHIKISIPEPEIKYATDDDFDRILEHIPEKYLIINYLLQFLRSCGARPSEIRALKWNKINFQEKYFIIDATFAINEYQPFTKTKQVRVLPLTDYQNELLKQVKSITKIISINSDNFVFTYKGKPITRTLLQTVFNKARDKSGVDVNLYQATRHSFCTKLINSGVNLTLISTLAGHKKSETTLKYAKLELSTLRNVLDRVHADRMQNSK